MYQYFIIRNETAMMSFNCTQLDSTPVLNEESRSTGAVTLKMYRNYFSAGANYLSLAAFAITFIIAQILFVGADYWLTLWTNAEELRCLQAINDNITESITAESIISEFTTSEWNLAELNSTELTKFADNETAVYDWTTEIDTTTGVYVYSGLIVGLVIMTMIYTIHFFVICMSASIKLHNNMFQSIIRAQLVFFDHNPLGNFYRFSDLFSLSFTIVICTFVNPPSILLL